MLRIALPMYNEEAVIGDYLKDLHSTLTSLQEPYEVVILNDGSTDNSVKTVEQLQKDMPIRLLHHHPNKGLGKTIKDLFLDVAKHSDPKDIIITMDSDNTHKPSYIPALIKKIEEGSNLVIVSRYAPGGGEVGFAFYRSLLSKGIRLLLRMFLPIKGVRDYSSGYRAYRASVIQNTLEKYGEDFITTDGFSCIVEFLIKANRANRLHVAELPLVLRYDLKKGKSKMKVAKTIREYLRLICKLTFSS